MRPVSYTLTGVQNGAVIPVDHGSAPTNIGIGVKVTGTITYTVQHTFDDIWDPNATLTWFDHPTLKALSANGDGNYASPPRGIRLITTAGTGTAAISLVQSGVK